MSCRFCIATVFMLAGSAAFGVPSVLVPRSAEKGVLIAAGEFAKYHELVTGTRPEITDVKRGTGPFVKIVFPSGDRRFDGRTDAYSLKSEGGDLVISGKNVRSLMYAVYDFFERRCACRWFWDGEVVPAAEKVDLTGLDVFERSRFEFRATHYFAHRGLTRFHATHWGPEDWKREIDFCLKSRVNFFMLQIGMDDLFQRAFPETVPYPDASVSEPPERPDRPGFDNHSPHWSLQYRGRLRKTVLDYAYERGLMHPAEFGTLTHWFSRTPRPFLEKMKPPFLPQATGNYSEPSGLVWDIREPKWFDMYWKLTEAQLSSWYKDDFLFTPGFDERVVFKDREKNLRFKIDVVTRYLREARERHPHARLLIEGWDLYDSWDPAEVREFIPDLDPETTVIWDYTADSSRKFTGHTGSENFTEWGVVGRFPYVFGMLMGLQRGNDIRLDYETVTVRQRVIRDDPFCVGYSLWPEMSHSDAFAWRYFTANCWRLSDAGVDELLEEFCKDRYGRQAERFGEIWKKTLPVSMLADWWTMYSTEVTHDLRNRWNDDRVLDRKILPRALEKVPEIFRELAGVERDCVFTGRDSIDLARTAADRLIVAAGYEMARRYRGVTTGETRLCELKELARAYVGMGETMARILALHPDYSLSDSLRRLSRIESVPNRDFERVLFENAANWYCRSHHAEFAARWYVDEMKDIAHDVVAAAERGGKEKLPGVRRNRMKELMELEHPILSQILDYPRTAGNYRRTMEDFAAAAEAFFKVVRPERFRLSGTNLPDFKR